MTDKDECTYSNRYFCNHVLCFWKKNKVHPPLYFQWLTDKSKKYTLFESNELLACSIFSIFYLMYCFCVERRNEVLLPLSIFHYIFIFELLLPAWQYTFQKLSDATYTEINKYINTFWGSVCRLYKKNWTNSLWHHP